MDGGLTVGRRILVCQHAVAVVLAGAAIMTACRPAVSGDAVRGCNQDPTSDPNCAELLQKNERQAAAPAQVFGAVLRGVGEGLVQAGNSRGCCSYHGGVQTCDYNVGRVVCVDGDYSPSCLCE